MENKTIKSYQKEILAKYKREKGGELRGYLAAPTRSQIRDACVYLFHRRNEKNDEYILNRFFQFKNDDNKLIEIENFGDGRFRSIENFLKEEVENTSVRNLNLISWLIDFKPRPYEEYSKFENSNSEEKPADKPESEISDKFDDDDNNDGLKINQEEEIEEFKRKKRKEETKKIVMIIGIVIGAILTTIGILKNQSVTNEVDDLPPNNEVINNTSNQLVNPSSCMTWADSIYVEVSCDNGPFSRYGTKVDTLDQMKLKKMKKVTVDAAYKFFSESNEPLIWYYKKSSREIEYFTAPGLHPTNGETLRKITPYIIETYVPIHSKKKNSFINQ
ncbi:hypothetical protein ACFSQJ_04345 [Croceitalea marina]|uniref:YARHG domain-containing protein n=1 Tax=Croceitalea marina TaxID=1775166 RepID=A0ABW5MRY9_9FLAO